MACASVYCSTRIRSSSYHSYCTISYDTNLHKYTRISKVHLCWIMNLLQSCRIQEDLYNRTVCNNTIPAVDVASTKSHSLLTNFAPGVKVSSLSKHSNFQDSNMSTTNHFDSTADADDVKVVLADATEIMVPGDEEAANRTRDNAAVMMLRSTLPRVLLLCLVWCCSASPCAAGDVADAVLASRAQEPPSHEEAAALWEQSLLERPDAVRNCYEEHAETKRMFEEGSDGDYLWTDCSGSLVASSASGVTEVYDFTSFNSGMDLYPGAPTTELWFCDGRNVVEGTEKAPPSKYGCAKLGPRLSSEACTSGGPACDDVDTMLKALKGDYTVGEPCETFAARTAMLVDGLDAMTAVSTICPVANHDGRSLQACASTSFTRTFSMDFVGYVKSTSHFHFHGNCRLGHMDPIQPGDYGTNAHGCRPFLKTGRTFDDVMTFRINNDGTNKSRMKTVGTFSSLNAQMFGPCYSAGTTRNLVTVNTWYGTRLECGGTTDCFANTWCDSKAYSGSQGVDEEHFSSAGFSGCTYTA